MLGSISLRFLSCLIALTCCTVAFGQSMTVTATNGAFAIDTYPEVEALQTNTSSFKLNVVSKTKAYNLSATITSKSFNPNTTTFPSVPLSITLRSITGVTTTGQVTGTIPMVESPTYAFLANNATKTGNTTAVWTYDLKLSAIGYAIPPGVYTYTITFRYTDGTNTFDRTFNATITVSTITSLSMTANSPASYSFTTVSQIQNGLTINNMNTFQIRSNVLWQLSIKSFTSSFSNTGTFSTPNVSPSVLQASITSPATTITVTPSDQTLKTGAIGNISVSGNTFNMSLKSTPGFSTGPGSYTITLVYTLAAQ
jgi:hypothetical protein